MRNRVVVRVAILLLSLAVLAGCAFRQAVERGDEFAQRGQWEDAYGAYLDATALDPDDSEAAAKLEKARNQMVNGRLERAEDELRSRNYDEVARLLRGIDEVAPNHKGAQDLMGRAGDDASARCRDALSKGNWPTAYDYGLVGSERLRSANAEACVGSVRKAYLGLAEKRERDGEYKLALDSLNVVASREPDQQHNVASHQKRVRESWRGQVSADAETLRREGQLGEATLKFLEADSILSTGADKARARELASMLAKDNKLKVRVTAKGDKVRADRYKRKAEKQLASMAPIELASTGAPLSLSTPAPLCKQTEKKKKDSVKYVAGTKQVPNPRWAQLDRDLHQKQQWIRQRQADIRDYESRIVRVRDDVGAAREREALRQIDAELSNLTSRYRDLESRAQGVQERIRNFPERIGQARRRAQAAQRANDLQRKLSGMEQDLRVLDQNLLNTTQIVATTQNELQNAKNKKRQIRQNLNSTQDQAQRQHLNQKLQRVQNRIRDLQRALSQAEQNLRNLQSQRDQIAMNARQVQRNLAQAQQDARSRGPSVAELQRKEQDARRKYNGLVDKCNNLQRRIRDQEFRQRNLLSNVERHQRELNRLRQTKSHMDQELVNVQNQADATSRRLANTPRLVTEKIYRDYVFPVSHWTRYCQVEVTWKLNKDQRTKREAQNTRDTAHLAYPKYNVRANPLAFPATDQVLQAKAEQRIEKNFETWLQQVASGHLTHLEKEGARLGGTSQSDLYIAAYVLGSRSRVIQSYFKGRGVKSYQSLR